MSKPTSPLHPRHGGHLTCGLNSMPQTIGQILGHLRLPLGWTESTLTTWKNIFLPVMLFYKAHYFESTCSNT